MHSAFSVQVQTHSELHLRYGIWLLLPPTLCTSWELLILGSHQPICPDGCGWVPEAGMLTQVARHPGPKGDIPGAAPQVPKGLLLYRTPACETFGNQDSLPVEIIYFLFVTSKQQPKKKKKN